MTILGRSLLLITVLILFNVGCWVAAALLFKPHATGDSSGLMGLALLSWTIGLRHALDADHISAIDNATRGLLNLGQLPTTCGLFFSLGHSTIVVVFIVAITISSDVYDKAGGFGKVGGIVGPAVSGSFLFVIGVVNSVILYRIIRDRRRIRRGLEPLRIGHHHASILVRILAPVTKIVDRPWKMYPVGLLFGLGFDTASSIALLAVSALAKQDIHGKHISSASIIILPLLFTAGMTIVDSLDSILMLYSYAGFPERGWSLIQVGGNPEKRREVSYHSSVASETMSTHSPVIEAEGGARSDSKFTPTEILIDEQAAGEVDNPGHDERREEEGSSYERPQWTTKDHSMSTLSILLTVISILLAFTISLITLISLIGEQCVRCRAAAETDQGLAGRWWRAWASASDASGYIGMGIVGGFFIIVSGWYLVRYIFSRADKRKAAAREA